jgi:hypothetical protein
MPIITIQVTREGTTPEASGVTAEQKAQLIKGASEPTTSTRADGRLIAAAPQPASPNEEVRSATDTFGVNLFAANPMPIRLKHFRDYAGQHPNRSRRLWRRSAQGRTRRR